MPRVRDIQRLSDCQAPSIRISHKSGLDAGWPKVALFNASLSEAEPNRCNVPRVFRCEFLEAQKLLVFNELGAPKPNELKISDLTQLSSRWHLQRGRR